MHHTVLCRSHSNCPRPLCRSLNLRLKTRPYPVVFSGSVPWLTDFEFGLNGRQRNTPTPIMLGLGELLASSNASRIRLTSSSYDSRFSHIDAALRRTAGVGQESACVVAGGGLSVGAGSLMSRLQIVTVSSWGVGGCRVWSGCAMHEPKPTKTADQSLGKRDSQSVFSVQSVP